MKQQQIHECHYTTTTLVNIMAAMVITDGDDNHGDDHGMLI